MKASLTPLEFLASLRWLDEHPLSNQIEPYRQRIFTEALGDPIGPGPRYNLVLAGRAKKNGKTLDLCWQHCIPCWPARTLAATSATSWRMIQTRQAMT